MTPTTAENAVPADLKPAADVLTRIVRGVRDDQLGAPTPCGETTVGGLLDHVQGLCLAFTAAATKTPVDATNQAPSADPSQLGTNWRARISDRLATLAEAWRADQAWAGMTRAGGQDLPGSVAGIIALDEIVVHAWDLAAATEQQFSCETELLEAVYPFVA
jgi:uncharacterized protein (TIGR03086 family)